MNRKILIIGKNSFIGKGYIEYSRYSSIEEVDIKSLGIEGINFEGVDTVLHLAAIVHQSGRISKQEYIRINSDLPVEVAIRARKAGVKQFVFISTTKVYGDEQLMNMVCSEQTECKPNDSYGLSKLMAEERLIALDTPNFTVSVIRTPLVYGKGVKANMLSLMKLVSYIPFLPFKGVKAHRSITFIGNLAAYIDRVIEIRAKGIFLAQDEKPVSVEELVNLIASGLKRKVVIFPPGKFLIYLTKKFFPAIYSRLYGSSEVDNYLTINALGLSIPYSTREGIEVMTNYYRSLNGK